MRMLHYFIPKYTTNIYTVAKNRFVFLCSLRAAESRVEEPGWGPQPSGEDYARNLLSAGAVHAAHYSNNVNPGIF